MIKTLEDIVSTSRGRGKKRLIVAYAEDSHTIEAVNGAVGMGLVDAVLVGEPDEIKKVCDMSGVDHSGFEIVAETGDVASVARAVKMVSSGEGDVLMKGLVSTDKYMHGILNKEYSLVPPKGVLSHVVVTQLPGYHKLLIVSDVAIIPYPDLRQKTAMIGYLIDTAHALGIECPKVACIAPTEQVLPALTSAVEGAVLAKMNDRGQIKGALVDGPLSLDVALFSEIAEVKKVTGSSVAGDADCLLFPNLDSANVFFKSANQLCKAELAAMVVGTKVPCVLTSRGDSSASKLYSIALACLATK